MLRRSACALAVACLLGAAPRARLHAQEATEEDKARARAHYQAGVRAYNIGDFDLAIREWKSGYRLHGSADFLFNIAQAYRGKGDYERALFFYNTYLRERPDAANAEEVRGLRDEVKKLLEDEHSTREKPPKEPIAADDSDFSTKSSEGTGTAETELPGTTGSSETGAGKAASPEPPGREAPSPSGTPGSPGRDRAEPSAGRTLKWGGLITGGAGLALAATGAGFSLAASAAESDLERAARNGDPWTPELREKESDADRNATLATVFYATGAAAVIGGAVAYYFGYRKDDEQWGLAVAPSLGARPGVTVRLDF